MAEPVDEGADLSETRGIKVTVTVTRHDPDTGEVTHTAAGVDAVRDLVTVAPAVTGGGGEVPAKMTTFWARADEITGFVPDDRDRITDADGAWVIDRARLVGGVHELDATFRR